MSALLQLTGIKNFFLAPRTKKQRGALPDGSQRSQRSEDLWSSSQDELHPGGVPESSANFYPRNFPLIRNYFCSRFLAPFQGARSYRAFSGGLLPQRRDSTSGYPLAGLRPAPARANRASDHFSRDV